MENKVCSDCYEGASLESSKCNVKICLEKLRDMDIHKECTCSNCLVKMMCRNICTELSDFYTNITKEAKINLFIRE